MAVAAVGLSFWYLDIGEKGQWWLSGSKGLVLFEFFAGDKAAADLQLGVGEAHGLASDGDRNATHFEEHGAWLDAGHIELDAALTRAHADFGWLLGHRRVREDTHPHLALTLQRAGDGDTGGFNLISRETATIEGLDAEVAEREGVASRGVAADLALAMLAPLGAGGLEIGHVGLVKSEGGRNGLELGVLGANPALDADLAGQGAGFGETVIDIFAEGMERDATDASGLDAGDFSATETTAEADTDAIGTVGHGGLDGLLHGATERDAAFELQGDVLSDELGDQVRALHFVDLENDVIDTSLTSNLLDLGAEILELIAFTADDDAWAGRPDADANLGSSAFDKDTRHSGLSELLLEDRADAVVLQDVSGEIALGGVPAGFPVTTDG